MSIVTTTQKWIRDYYERMGHVDKDVRNSVCELNSDAALMAELLERADEIIAMSLPMTERYGGREWLADFERFQKGK